MARKKKQTLPAVQSGRLVQPLTKSQSKLLDALIDDPRLSPADLCDVAGVPAYTWRRALRSPAFAAALLDAQRSALDASRLSRTQAAIEKAQTSPAFARLCFQIDGSIKSAPSLVQVLNQQIVNMPISQLRKEFESGATVQIPNLNYIDQSEVRQLAVIPSEQEQNSQKGVILSSSSSPGCPRFNDNQAPITLPLPISDQYEVRSGESTKSEVVEAQHSEVRSGTGYEVIEYPAGCIVRGDDRHTRVHGIGRAFKVTRAAPGSRAAYREHDHDTE